MTYLPPVGSISLSEVLSATREVQKGLGYLLGSLGIQQPTMSDLRIRLGLDKSVASRLARAIRSREAGPALREMPGSDTIERLVRRCEDLGVDAALCASVRSATARLEEAIKAFPGDRTALIAAVAGNEDAESDQASVSPVSRIKLRAARRGAYNALLVAQGISCDTSTLITILGPGREAGTLDQAMVISATGIRRFRPGTPHALLSIQGHPGQTAGRSRTTLSGAPLLEDPSAALIPEFCSASTSQLRLECRGRFHSLVLDSTLPPIDEPMHLAYGVINVGFETARATPANMWTLTSYTVARACRMHLREVLLHRETFGDRAPEALFTSETVPAAQPEVSGPDRSRRGAVDHGEQLVCMGSGYARRDKPGHDVAVPLALRACELLGKDPTDYVRYRMVVEYPLPFVRGEVWVRLPD